MTPLLPKFDGQVREMRARSSDSGRDFQGAIRREVVRVWSGCCRPERPPATIRGFCPDRATVTGSFARLGPSEKRRITAAKALCPVGLRRNGPSSFPRIYAERRTVDRLKYTVKSPAPVLRKAVATSPHETGTHGSSPEPKSIQRRRFPASTVSGSCSEPRMAASQGSAGRGELSRRGRDRAGPLTSAASTLRHRLASCANACQWRQRSRWPLPVR